MSDKKGLELLREPFSWNAISKLPKPTKAQTDALKNNPKTGIRCDLCGGWHHKDVVHLDYVGHAALTDRLLDADPLWAWEPVAYKDGLPAFDNTGGLWIKLTVCGHTRLGYGHAASSTFKEIGSREKEVIGDALRNAAMRFGAALDLWHKGDLHLDEDEPTKKEPFSNIIPPKEIPKNIPKDMSGLKDATKTPLPHSIITGSMYEEIKKLVKDKSIPHAAVVTVLKNKFSKSDAKTLTYQEYQEFVIELKTMGTL